MSGDDTFWDAFPGQNALDRESNVEMRLVLPLLEALGYDRNVDIEAKQAVVFQQGRKLGRKPEADFVCYYGPVRDKNNSLLVVEAKPSTDPLPPGKNQGESYAQNLRAPLLVLTNGREFEIWQQQPSLESQLVLQCQVIDLPAHRGEIERYLNKIAVRDYCKTLASKSIAEQTADFGKYETAELTRLLGDAPAVDRTLKQRQGGDADALLIPSDRLLQEFARGAVIVGTSGYGKTTLSRALLRQAIELRWSGARSAIVVEAPLPDLQASGSSLVAFLHARVQAHQPGVTDAAFKDHVRNIGVTVICDSLDRTSAAFQQTFESEAQLLLRDFPLSQLFVFSRADTKPTLALPVLSLEELSPSQLREMEEVILGDGSGKHYSIIGTASPTLQALCTNPLLLKLALDYWKLNRRFPDNVDILFRSWLESVLEAEPNDQLSRLMRERALSIIALATIESPVSGVKLLALLKDGGVPERVLNELIRSDAVKATGSVYELQHDGLADYLRARELAQRSAADQQAAMAGMSFARGSFLPVLLMAQLPDANAQDAVWRNMLSGPIDAYFDALRFRKDTSEDLGRLNPEQLSHRYLTDLLNGVEEPLDGFFPALRTAIVHKLAEEPAEALAVIGAAGPHAISYKVHGRTADQDRVVVGVPDFPGTIRGVNLDRSRYRSDSARMLGIALLKSSVESVVGAMDLEGGVAWAAERLVGRVRFLQQHYKLNITTADTLDQLQAVLQPMFHQWHRDPFPGKCQFSVQSMLDDVAALKAAGVTALDPWWLKYGWNDCLSPNCLSDDNLAGLLNEQYRRTQLIYKEIAERSFARFTDDFIFYPILPLRWTLRVARKGALNRTFVIYPRWKPVASWAEAGADVSFDGPWPDPIPPWDDVRKALLDLGRKPIIPRFGGFTTHAGFGGSPLHGGFTGATPATDEAISWLKEDIKRIFRNMPHSDGSFAA